MTLFILVCLFVAALDIWLIAWWFTEVRRMTEHLPGLYKNKRGEEREFIFKAFVPALDDTYVSYKGSEGGIWYISKSEFEKDWTFVCDLEPEEEFDIADWRF